MTLNHEQTWRAANVNPDSFWGDAAQAIDWNSSWDAVVEGNADDGYRWFPGATLNTCYNAVDRHVVSGRADQRALVYDSPVTGQQRSFTYAQLKDEVSRTAGMLRDLGVVAGDRVIIYMPMVPEAVFAMLACARLGAVHSVVFGGFAAKELATRIDDAKPQDAVSTTFGFASSIRVASSSHCSLRRPILLPTSTTAASSCSATSTHVNWPTRGTRTG